LSAVSASLSTSAESMSGASSQFTSASGGLRSVIEPLAEFASENRAALETISSAISTSSEAMSSGAEKIEVSVAELNSSVQERLKQLDKGDEALESYVNGINTSTGRVLESIAGFVQKTDRGFADSLGQLKGAIEELEAVAEQLAEASNKSN
jgi:ABC-type transporter Mla subunit MlaD